MRPTIPIGPWKIAVDLRATHEIQRRPGTPAFGCKCTWCDNWSRAWPRAFPGDLASQLQRLGIDLAHPTDFYASDEDPHGAQCRVIFHVVGKVLSGPVVWREDAKFGRTYVYSTLREHPSFIGLAVVPSHETWDDEPLIEGEKQISLIQVDFRLFVPVVGPAEASLTQKCTSSGSSA